MSSTKELVKDNFDINVWNRGAYYSEGKPESEHYDEWVLCPYTLTLDGEEYNIDNELDELNLELTEEEANQLTLGWGNDLGGDHCEDDDFWIDHGAFVLVYKDIPKRVTEWFDIVFTKL